jgi:hypothetical protein
VRIRSRLVAVFVACLCLGGRADEQSARPPLFDKVYLVFAEEHSAEFISGFGHLFLCLAPAEAVSADDLLLCPAVNFGVDLSPDGAGLFVGSYVLQPSFGLVRQNSFFQQRRLFFFELHTDEAGRARLREELGRRLGRKYPYDFISLNCGYYLTDLLTVASGGGTIPRPWSYLTPRQAADRLLRAHGTKGGLVAASPGLLAEQMLQQEFDASRRSALAASARSLAASIDCADPRLKLLYLRLWESRVPASEYAQVTLARDALLRTAEGRAAAREIQAVETHAFARPDEVWPVDEEGPDFGFGLYAGSSSAGPDGISLRADLGIRGRRTSPVPLNLLREVRLLGLDLDVGDDGMRGELTLGEISTIRDFTGLSGAGSSGAKISFNEREVFFDTRGLCADLWSGLATRSDRFGWIGLKAHLLLDRLTTRPRGELVPEVFCLQEACGFEIDFSVIRARDDAMAWSLGLRSLSDDPSRTGGVSLRYEQLAEVGGRLRLDWRYRY